MMMPARVAMALQADGWWLRSEIIWHKPNPMPESVTDRPTNAHEKLFLLTKSARYFYDAEAVRVPHVREWTPETNNPGVAKWKVQTPYWCMTGSRTLRVGRNRPGGYKKGSAEAQAAQTSATSGPSPRTRTRGRTSQPSRLRW